MPLAEEALAEGWQRSARVSLIDRHGRVISNFHTIPLPAMGQKEASGWVFDKEAAANNVCIVRPARSSRRMRVLLHRVETERHVRGAGQVVPPEEDGGEGSEAGATLCVELLTERGGTECVACMKLPLGSCFSVIKKAGKSRKIVPLSPALLGGGVLTAESLGEANDGMEGAKKGKTPPAHHLELEISKTTRCA